MPRSGCPGRRKPLGAVPLAAARLEPALLDRLLAAWPLLATAASPEAGALPLGFELCVDHPARTEHRYVEGYFHAVYEAHDRAVPSVHPRHGYRTDRSPAPAPMVAFCEALRRTNADLLSTLRADLARSRHGKPLAEVLQRGFHFADLSVQLHWGERIGTEDVAWHIDAPNSYLHLALGLRGSRALHARRHFLSSGAVSRNCMIGATDEREVIWQAPGDAYLSSPCCYPHAVEYAAAPWEACIVAVQCRLLLAEDELFGCLDVDPQASTAVAIFQQIATRGLKLPSLVDVDAVLQEMGHGVAAEITHPSQQLQAGM